MSLLTSEQLDYKRMVANFMKNEVEPVMAECDRTGELPMEAIKKGLDIGFQMLEIPEAYGGGGVSSQDYSIIMEEMAAYDAGFCTTFGANDLAIKSALTAATPEQMQYIADILAEGKLAAFCLTEPQAGSDAANIHTTAVKEGDAYVLNGSKCFITNGGIADVYIVFAMTDRSKGVKGISAFIVERSMGVKSGKEEDKMGIRLSNTTEVVFDNVRVPAANLLGREGTGFFLAMKTLDLGRITAAAGAVGTMRHAVELCTKYAMERKTFGKPIGVNQAVSFMIADMKIAEETARAMMMHAARLADAGEPFTIESAAAKTYASDAAVQVALDAIQIFGGYGYSREYPVEKLLRDAKILQIYEGTNQIQRQVIVGNMLKH